MLSPLALGGCVKLHRAIDGEGQMAGRRRARRKRAVGTSGTLGPPLLILKRQVLQFLVCRFASERRPSLALGVPWFDN
jgi:hypothetical protein